MTIIDPTLYLKNQMPSKTSSTDLGKDEFLNILMTQLQNQDPLDPMDDRAFISQMASFSSLEQMTNMANSVDTLVQSQLISPVIQYSHMVGKNVSYEPQQQEPGEKQNTVTSKVVAVSQMEGWAILELENGEEIYADSILQVKSGVDEGRE
jgi:flagellar basal-body rod modification protein FlgD